MESPSIIGSLETSALIPGQKATIIIDGPPSSGKSTRGRLFSESVGFAFFDTGDYLRANKDSIPDEVLQIMKAGKGVPDEFIVPILKRQVVNAPHLSRVFVGVRSVDQARELLYNLYNFQHRIIYLKLERNYEDCFELLKGRSESREDDNEEIFKERWAYYESHTHDVERFFSSRGAVRVVRYKMTRELERDKREILKLLQPHCANYELPKGWGDVVHVTVQ